MDFCSLGLKTLWSGPHFLGSFLKIALGCHGDFRSFGWCWGSVGVRGTERAVLVFRVWILSFERKFLTEHPRKQSTFKSISQRRKQLGGFILVSVKGSCRKEGVWTVHYSCERPV